MGIITAAVVGVAVAGASMYQQRQAQKQQKKANATARRQENVRALRERQQSIRSQRIANASALTAGTNAGVGGSSMMEGSMASFNTTAAANVNFTDQMNALTMQRMQHIAKSDSYMNRAGMIEGFGKMFSIGHGAYSAAKNKA